MVYRTNTLLILNAVSLTLLVLAFCLASNHLDFEVGGLLDSLANLETNASYSISDKYLALVQSSIL